MVAERENAALAARLIEESCLKQGIHERDESMPSSKVLIALADALDVSPEYLISDRDIQLEGIEFRKKKPVTPGQPSGSIRRQKRESKNNESCDMVGEVPHGGGDQRVHLPRRGLGQTS